MNDDKWFLTQIKKSTLDVYEKGVVVKNTLEDAKQGLHAYFGAYGYNHDATVDYVACYIADMYGNILYREVDDRRPRDIEPENE